MNSKSDLSDQEEHFSEETVRLLRLIRYSFVNSKDSLNNVFEDSSEGGSKLNYSALETPSIIQNLSEIYEKVCVNMESEVFEEVVKTMTTIAS